MAKARAHRPDRGRGLALSAAPGGGYREPHSELLRPGETCWRLARAGRASLLVDADAYYSTLRRAMREARCSIFIVGWDLDSRLAFPPGGENDGLPRALGDFLDALLERTRTLRIYALAWDFAMLYAPDREFLPLYNFGWRRHHRLRFHLDDRHPPGGSHHQKIVVLDDALAFVGGIDLTKCRWDTPAHAPDEPRRVGPDGAPYAPFHDVQWMVDGDAAADLGELARRRWKRATGRAPRVQAADGSRRLWPEQCAPRFEAVEVAIARTAPGYAGERAVREVHALYLDAIAAAKRCIYLENQYFTARDIGEALAGRLGEPGGPEVVLVTRRTGGGWLERNTMELLRARLLTKTLEPADAHGRLRVYCPEQAGLGEDCIDLHSKLMIVDDRVLHAGSANLNNRSMGVDTECDLAIEATTPAQRRAIVAVRDGLLAEHLGVEPAAVADALEQRGSLIAAIESLRGNARTLDPLAPELDLELDAMLPDDDTVDPEQPVDPDRLLDQVVPEEERPIAAQRVVWIATALIGIALLALAWRWGPLREWLDAGALRSLVGAAERSAWTPAWMLLAYVGASLIAVPITLLIVATAVVFGPWTTVLYALAGSLLGAAAGFALGHALGRGRVRRLAGSRLNALSRRLGDGGVFPVLLLRMVPVAPFTVFNLVAGASHLGLRAFLIGTALGMAPGILALAVFSDRLIAVLREPGPAQFGLLALVLVLVAVGALAMRAALRRHARKRSDGPD